MRLVAFYFVICLVLVSTASSQSFRGKVLGTVTDQNGAILQGAKVTAKNVGTASLDRQLLQTLMGITRFLSYL